MKQNNHMVRRPLIVAIALLTVLVTATALSVGIRMSKQVEIKSIARQAVMQNYGLDQQSLAMFSERAVENNGVWTVTYGTWKPNNAGEYTVDIYPDGRTETAWSMEKQEGAWGQTEIAAYIQQKNEKAYQQMAEEAAYGIPTAEPIPSPTPVPGAKMTHEQAISAADEAMKQQYRFQEKGLSEFKPDADFEDGVWHVEYQANGWHWKDGYLSVKAGSYLVKIDDATGQTVDIQWNIAAEDPNTYTRETFGKALVYDAQCMEWVAEIRSQFEAAYTAVEMSRWPVSVEEMARLDGLMISAGFDPAKYNHVVPGETDLSLEAALDLTAKALEETYGVKREVLDECNYAYTDLTQEKTHRQWYFWIQSNDLQMGWQITLNAETGEILDMVQESFAAGNG